MPVYSFENPKTGDEYELTMSYNELEAYLKEHPEVNQTFRMNLVDPVGIGVTKPPADFQKYVLGKVKASAPGANKDIFEKRWQIAKEI
jgi:hypothetical protein